MVRSIAGAVSAKFEGYKSFTYTSRERREVSSSDSLQEAGSPYHRQPGSRGGVVMNIGEPLRTIIVEPLELPIDEPESEPAPEPLLPEPEPEPVPANV
jgi:hypothetical protein